MRDAVSGPFLDMAVPQILTRVRRHHYTPSMHFAVSRFLQRVTKGEWVVDIGVGWGWHWLEATIEGSIIGLDFSFSSLLVAQRVLGDRVDRSVHLVCADAMCLPVKNVRGIWSVQTFQHLPPHSLAGCLQRCAELIANGGILEAYDLNGDRPFRWIRAAKYRLRGRSFYLRNRSGPESRELMSGHFVGAEVTILYNEVLFHPEVRFVHALPLASLDMALGRAPILGRFTANQIGVRVVVPHLQDAS